MAVERQMEASEFLRPGAPNLTLRSLEFRAESHNASPSQEFPSCGAAAVACASLRLCHSRESGKSGSQSHYRHGRAWPGHPRFGPEHSPQIVDARPKAGHDECWCEEATNLSPPLNPHLHSASPRPLEGRAPSRGEGNSESEGYVRRGRRPTRRSRRQTARSRSTCRCP
jgi:hypothetical protein